MNENVFGLYVKSLNDVFQSH